MAASSHPRAAFDELVITETATDLIVYDPANKHLHHLNHASAAIWRAADGTKSPAAIQHEVGGGATLESVELGLSLLAQAGLVSNYAGSASLRPSRRTLIRHLGVGGAIAIPTVVSITAPAAAQVPSGQCGRSCPSTLNSECSNQIGSCGQCRDFGASGYLCCNPGVGGAFPCNQ